ncbi:MAG: ABC transporter permease [Anaerolineae bacterium]|nr:ABC transporter permease [Anaerolineae bacterium]MBN8617768.1 ABC transporter permease [Anaerolineae bacterium]
MHENALLKSVDRTKMNLITDRRRLLMHLRRFAPWLMLFGLVLVWQLIYMLRVYPPFIIPAPVDVLVKFRDVLLDGRLFNHTIATLVNVLVGLVAGLLLALTLGYAIAKTPILEDILSPIIVAIQSAPVVAYAPLLVIWFGSGPSSKIVTGALIVFFPMLMNTIVGIRNVPASLKDLMRSMQATPWQTFTRLEIPSAMPILMSGLKISATLAVIGAVVGEFISSNAGLGFLINLARSQYDTPLVLVAVLMLTLIARLLYGVVSLLERSLLSWQRRSQRN